jgi:hypothetical protein
MRTLHDCMTALADTGASMGFTANALPLLPCHAWRTPISGPP